MSMTDQQLQQDVDRSIRNAALSGGLSGGVLGGITSALGGTRNPRALLRDTILGALGTGALVGGSTYLGNKMMGNPDRHEIDAYTMRGGIGGALGGGALGAGVGAVLGSRKIKTPKWISNKAAENPMTNNILTDWFKRAIKPGGSEGAIRGAAIGGAGLGAGAAALASDEGMQLDFIINKLREEEREAYRKRLTNELV